MGRSLTRGLARRLMPALGLVFAAAAPHAADDALNGRALYEDTPGVSGINTLSASCNNCHDVQSRRRRIAGNVNDATLSFAAIDFDTAMTRFVQAVQNQPAMGPFGALSAQQARDIAAYIADTPKTTPEQIGARLPQLDFAPAAINSAATAQTVDLTAAVATSESLRIASVAIVGADAARFTRVADACEQQTLNPGMSCRVSLGFSAPDTASYSATLTFTMHQGSSAIPITRSVLLSGAVPVAVPPPATTPPSGGGGALDWPWLAALALVIVQLQRRRG